MRAACRLECRPESSCAPLQTGSPAWAVCGPAPPPLLAPLLTQVPPGPRPPRRFTNITRDFRGTLDYILYTSDSLAPAATLEMPDESECRSKSNAGGCWVGGGAHRSAGGGESGAVLRGGGGGARLLTGALALPMAQRRPQGAAGRRRRRRRLAHLRIACRRPGANSCQHGPQPRLSASPLPPAPPALPAGLPNDSWSSDHVALMVEFNYVQPQGGAGAGGAGAGAPAAGGGGAAAANS